MRRSGAAHGRGRGRGLSFRGRRNANGSALGCAFYFCAPPRREAFHLYARSEQSFAVAMQQLPHAILAVMNDAVTPRLLAVEVAAAASPGPLTRSFGCGIFAAAVVLLLVVPLAVVVVVLLLLL